MLTVSDLIFTSILPLIIGLSVAVFFRKITRSRYSPSLGALSTLIAGYFGRYATMNYAYAQGETTVQRLFQSFSETATQLLNPPTAIQWIPIIATLCFAITIIIARVRSTDSLKSESDSSPRRFLNRLLLFGLLVIFTSLAVGRILWTSVYFTDRYSIAAQTGYVVLPASFIAATWLGGFDIWKTSHQLDHSPISRWASVSTLLLSASALVLLAASGSFTFGLLQLPVLSAAIVSTVLTHRAASRCPLKRNAWLIASAVNLPVAFGFFFAELRWETAVLIFLSSMLLAFFPPLVSQSNIKKAGIATAACLPAMAAAFWAAIALGQSIASPYDGY